MSFEIEKDKEIKMRFEIEKDKKITPIQRHKSMKYPWPNMEVGDSFFVPDGSPGISRVNNGQMVCYVAKTGDMWARSNRLDWKFSYRRVEGGYRIWRVK